MKRVVHFDMLFNKVEVRSEDSSIVIQGMASTPRIDRYRSIITPDAIKNGMSNYIKNPIILLSHDSDKPIGTMTDHRVDNTGLFIVAKLVRNTDNVFENIRDGITKGFSIGFIPLNRVYKTKDGVPLQSLTAEELDNLDYNDVVREITEIDMVEISVCNTPANADALFSMARAIKNFFDTQEKRSFGIMTRDVKDTDEDTTNDVQNNTDETANETGTTEDETTETEQEENDDKDNEDNEDIDEEAEKTEDKKEKLQDEEFKAVDDDEDEDDEDDDTDDEENSDEEEDEGDSEEENKQEDQQNTDNTEGQEVANADENTANADKANDGDPEEKTEQRSVSFGELQSIRKVLDEVIDTLSVFGDKIETLEAENNEIRAWGNELQGKLSNIPMTRAFKTIGGLGTNKRNSEPKTIITTLKQAKREAMGADEDDDED